VGHPTRNRSRSHLKTRQRHNGDLGGGDDRDQQRRRRKPELTSDQGDDFLLRVVIALDVQRGRSQALMTGESLDVSEATAYLADFWGSTSDEGPATALA
jgi:hypothetical protein